MINSSKTLDYTGLFILSAIWGSSFLFIKFAIETIHPSLLTFLRLLTASFFLYIYLKIVKKQSLSFSGEKKDIILIALLGNVIPFNLISWSETRIDSVNVAILIGTMPMFTFIISHYIYKVEKINRAIVLGLLIGFIGMVVLIDENNSNLPNSFNLSSLPNLMVIFAAIFYALAANCVKSVTHMNSLQLATSSSILATVIALPVCLVLMRVNYINHEYIISNISLKSIYSCLVLGIVCTGLAILIFFNLIKRQSAGFASQSNFFIPCFGVLWSFLFLDERLSILLIISLILIVAGVAFVHVGRKKNNKH